MSKYKGKFEELELAIYHMIMEIACDVFKILLEEYDDEIMENRDKQRYRNMGLRKCLVWYSTKDIFTLIIRKKLIYFCLMKIWSWRLLAIIR